MAVAAIAIGDAVPYSYRDVRDLRTESVLVGAPLSAFALSSLHDPGHTLTPDNLRASLPVDTRGKP